VRERLEQCLRAVDVDVPGQLWRAVDCGDEMQRRQVDDDVRRSLRY
jgi:hypothetical protein